MPILNMDDVVDVLANHSQRKKFWKPSFTTTAGHFFSLYGAGNEPEAAAVPVTGGGDIPTADTTGSLHFTVGEQSYLMQVAVTAGQPGKLVIYDRLWQNSGLSGTVAVDTAIPTMTPLTRPDINGANTELWAEIYTQIGSTAAVLTVKYTNSAGTPNKSATFSKASSNNIVKRMFPLQLASGDTGVQAVTSYSWSISTGTAGNFGLVILRRIAEIPLSVSNGGYLLDFAGLGMPQIPDDAALAMMVLCSTTTLGDLYGSLIIGQKD